MTDKKLLPAVQSDVVHLFLLKQRKAQERRQQHRQQEEEGGFSKSLQRKTERDVSSIDK